MKIKIGSRTFQLGSTSTTSEKRIPIERLTLTEEERDRIAASKKFAEEQRRAHEEGYRKFFAENRAKPCQIEDSYVFNVIDRRAVPLTNIASLHIQYAPGRDEWSIVGSQHFAVYANLKMGKGYYTWGEPLQYFYDYNDAIAGLNEISQRLWGSK